MVLLRWNADDARKFAEKKDGCCDEETREYHLEYAPQSPAAPEHREIFERDERGNPFDCQKERPRDRVTKMKKEGRAATMEALWHGLSLR